MVVVKSIKKPPLKTKWIFIISIQKLNVNKLHLKSGGVTHAKQSNKTTSL